MLIHNITKAPPFEGCSTAIITPFKDTGEIDHKAFELLAQRQVEAGISALTLLGTTGEAPTVTNKERHELIRSARSICKDDVKLIVGCGSNSTEKAVMLTENAVSLGADIILAVTPYYNKANRDGIISHYKKIADAAEGKDVIIYNIPSRTGMTITPDIACELSEIPNITGIKEAGGDFSLSLMLKHSGGLPLYCGNDDANFPFLCIGASGVISVLSNIIPDKIVKLCRCVIKHDMPSARLIHSKYLPLTKALFSEVNPIPVKYALSLMGLCSEKVRLPLGKISESSAEKVKNELFKLGII